MLTPGVAGLSREEALHLIEKSADAEDRLARVVAGVRRFLAQADSEQPM